MLRVVAPGRIEIEGTVSDVEIRALAGDPDLKFLMLSRPPEGSIWSRLNERLFAVRPDVQLRVYGYYGLGPCDLGFASQMTLVERFSADSLRSAINVDCIATMPKLRSLGLGIFDLASLDVLAGISTDLVELGIGGAKTTKLDLGVLARFPALRKLSLEKQVRNIEVLSEVAELEDLTLRSIATKNLDYLAPLRRLRDLDIKLGGITDLSALDGKASLRALALWQVRGLSELGIVSSLTGLQHLNLQSLPHVKALPSLRNLTKLRRVYLENMRGLENLNALAEAPALAEVIHVSSALTPEDHAVLFRNPAIQRISAGFGSTKKNQVFEAMQRKHGIGVAEGKFVYV
jgi:hypothetical protein